MAKSPSAQTRPATASQPKTPAQPRKPAPASASKVQPVEEADLDPDTDAEEDEIYALVSVLYHSLQGASAARKYIRDAQTAKDQELVEFFEGCREDDRARAEEAKQLLAARVDDAGSSEDEDEDDEDEDDEDDDDDEK